VPPCPRPAGARESRLGSGPSSGATPGDSGFADRPQSREPFPARAWTRAGGIVRLPAGHSLRGFVTAGTAEHTDALSAFRLGSGLPFRSEFPLVLHGYYVDEVLARRFVLVNLACPFPPSPATDRA